jgi:hypothetical protein
MTSLYVPPYNSSDGQIQHEIDRCLAQLQEGWSTPMIMSMHVGEDDVIDFISSKQDVNKERNFAYFDHHEFPPGVGAYCNIHSFTH